MKNRGYILIEVLVSIGLLSLMLIPLSNQVNQYIKLKNNEYRVKNIEFREIQIKVLKGYNENFLKGEKQGLIKGIGNYSQEVQVIFISDELEKLEKILFPEINIIN